jgi:16S rRNA (cytosine967-C5)-methyltransferase
MALLKLVSGQKPRQIAARVLQQRRAGGGFVEDLLEIALHGAALSPADRGLCQEITYGVVRWQAALDWLIARKTGGREQKPALQNLLRLGLYQIFWLDRIPDHAAVHETVELAKQNGFGSQAGFVNAVLRGCLRERDETRKLLAGLKMSQPALGWSHPEWLVARWQRRWSGRADLPVGQDARQRVPTDIDAVTRLLEWNNTPPKTFARVNTLKFSGTGVSPVSFSATKLANPTKLTGETPVPLPSNAGDLLARWREENVEYDFVRCDFLGRADLPVGQDAWQRVPTDFENLVFELKSHPPLNSLASFRDGWFYLQDPSTLLAVGQLGPQPGETILDFCAAPGGKTTFIAQLMNNQGRIVAQDVSEERLKWIQENCARLGVTCVETILPSTLNPQPSTGFDRVLVDAPCSNTGVMRRRVDLRWRIQPEEIERLRAAQLNLLQQAATQVKPGGILVYSTCSLEPEENQKVVKQFLGDHADFKLESERELLPFVDGVDGAYVARMKRG